jgi:hypothetical protein
MRNAYKIDVEKREKPLGRATSRWEDNINGSYRSKV